MATETPAENKCKKDKKPMSGKQFVLNIIFYLAVIPIAIVGITQLGETARHEEDTDLKRRLAEKGMSAQEIHQVVYGNRYRYYPAPSVSRSRSSHYEREQAKIEADLYRHLREEGYSRAEVNRILDITWEGDATIRSSSSLRRYRSAVEVTKSLIKRGLSAEDIERVLSAPVKRSSTDSRRRNDLEEAIQERMKKK